MPDASARAFALALLVPVGALIAPSGALAADPVPDEPPTAQETPSVSVPYGVEFRVSGEDGSLTSWLQGVSRLVVLQGEPPATPAGLRQRVDADLERFAQALRARGYYDATLAAEVDTEARPARVVISAEPGTLYTLASVVFDYRGTDERADLPQDPGTAGLEVGAPARAQAVLDGEHTLTLALQRAARPLARVTDRLVVVDHARHVMEVTYTVEPGPKAAFGPLVVRGLEKVDETFVQAMVPWREGDPYDERVVREFRKRLSESRLFGTLDMGPEAAVGPDGRIPIHLTLSEAPPRTIAAGVSYGTDRGPGASARWEHRNLLGAGEHLRIEAVGALSEQSVAASLRKPYFLSPRQTLTASSRVAREDLEAYTGLVAEAAAGVERVLSEHWRVSGNLSLEMAHLTWPGEDVSRPHALAGLPVQVSRDATDNALDPTRGTRFSLTAQPFAGVVESESTGFLVVDALASGYVPALPDRLVLAGRARLASLTGASLDRVPPNRRLYAGGGGSVRGFGYQMIGPLAANGDPLGGRSAAEIGVEARIKITPTIAVVPFLEGGLVGPESWPSFDETIRWGAGLGARYHTDFGPLRVDLGVPLNPRDEDDSFQVYISLGQAF
ncbi:autotransporter assembly complex protein TamA [Pararhodospirillum oryzae]|uniref:Outer membrane protein assembly factor n=1 Tax=Pararhodospirillum oryzae TaxID=478448 RepID=A0A512H864_9PROT|nr:autotransporter assembly complex family protein [Pararhodospirillum oryzae]GEO81647.1 outer membrane protein assembly factor [Pararhodospirillum oryzae]